MKIINFAINWIAYVLVKIVFLWVMKTCDALKKELAELSLDIKVRHAHGRSATGLVAKKMREQNLSFWDARYNSLAARKGSLHQLLWPPPIK